MEDLFPYRLRTAREARNKRPEEIAVAIGKSASTVLSYERGDRSPSPQILLRLSATLEVSLDWLLGASDAEPDWSNKRKDAPAERERLDMDSADVATEVTTTTGPDLLTQDRPGLPGSDRGSNAPRQPDGATPQPKE